MRRWLKACLTNSNRVETHNFLHVAVEFFHLLESAGSNNAAFLSNGHADLLAKRLDVLCGDGQRVQDICRSGSCCVNCSKDETELFFGDLLHGISSLAEVQGPLQHIVRLLPVRVVCHLVHAVLYNGSEHLCCFPLAFAQGTNFRGPGRKEGLQPRTDLLESHHGLEEVDSVV